MQPDSMPVGVASLLRLVSTQRSCVPNQRNARGLGLCRRTVSRMGLVRASKTLDPPVDRSVTDRLTGDLLGIVLRTAGVESDDLDEVARAIDAGDLAIAAAMPDELSNNGALPAGVASVLMAAFELARRAAVVRAPALIRGPADVAAIAKRELGGRSRECVLVIACDASNRIRRTVVASQGSVDGALVPIREILNAVLRCDARAFALAHNHPCGDPEPSGADIAATRRVADAAAVVGLRFLGHVVVGDDSWASSPM